MKKILLLALMLWGVLQAQTQSKGYIRYDSVILQKVGGNSEFIVLNGSRSLIGAGMYNMGNGRTAFVNNSGDSPVLPAEFVKSGFLWYDSTGADSGLYVYHRPYWVKVGKDFIAGRGITKGVDTVSLGGLTNDYVGLYIRNNFDAGGRSSNIFITNRQTIDSLDTYENGGHTTTLNRPNTATDLTYSQYAIGINRNYKEKYGDTLNLQYGGAFNITDKRSYDSTSSIFGRYGVKKYAVLNDKGVEVNNQFFPPIDTLDIFAGKDGQNATSFYGIMGIGASWGYNVRVFSSLPNYPLSNYNSAIDFQRDASRTRMRRMTGAGVSSYLSTFRGWQASITGSSTQVGHYIGKTIGYHAWGNTDYDIASATTKTYALGVEKFDSVFAFYAEPQWRSGNTVYNGYGYVSAGDSDYNYIAGKLRIGGGLPTRDNGGIGMKGFELNSEGKINNVLWMKNAGYITSDNTVSFGTHGFMKFQTLDSTQNTRIGSEFGKGAYIELGGKSNSSSIRSGIDMYFHNTYNDGQLRLIFMNDAGMFDRRYILNRKKAYMEVSDSFSLQAPAYKFGGMPRSSSSTWVLAYDSTTNYASYIRTDNLGISGGGGGSGTVNSGTANRLAYYAGTGTAVSELAAITANRALISDASGLPTHSTVTNTELGYVSGVTSAIQTQLGTKWGTSGTTVGDGTNIIGSLNNRSWDMWANGTRVARMDSTGSFSIGITSPNPSAYASNRMKLMVQGDFGVFESGAMKFSVYSSSSNYLMNIRNASSGDAVRLNATTGGTNWIGLDNTVKVGIGTVTPTTALTVNGQVRINAITSATTKDSMLVINAGVVEAAKAPRNLTPLYTSVGNVGAGEDDLQSTTLEAGLLATDGDYIEFVMSFSVAANSTLKVKYGATQLFSFAALATDAVYRVTGTIIRTSATTQRATFEMKGGSGTTVVGYQTPAETLSGTVVLKATGEGTSNNDIVQTITTIRYFPNTN